MINRPINPWWTVAAGTLGSALGAGAIMAYTFGIMAAPMAAEFGWDRSVLAANTTAFLIGSGIGAVSLGFLISRFGIRAPSAILVAVFGICFAAVGAMPADPLLHQLLFLLIGIGGGAATAFPYSVAISGFFNARRGLALGIVVAGAGLGGTFGPRLVQAMVDGWGWRSTFAIVGLTGGLFPMLGLVFLVRTPEGAVSKRVIEPGAERPTPFAEVARDAKAWLILFPILFVSIAAWGAMGTMVPMLRDHRLDPATIASILSFAGLAAWGARLVVGYLLDKIFAPFVAAAIFLLAATGLVLLIVSSNMVAIYLGVAFISMALGTEADMVTFLASRYFKLIDFSRLVGILWVIWAWGGGIGTVLIAGIYARADSYTPALLLFAAVLLAGAAIICFLGPYRNPIHTVRGVRPTAEE